MTGEQTEALVLVLLPVYNGSEFLAEQMESVLGQQHTSLILLCRDDGSTDRSASILEDYAHRYPQKIWVLKDGDGKRGVVGSFSCLMQRALEWLEQREGPAYVALCDQDDVWCPDRLSAGLKAMRQLETEMPGKPLLVHSDLRVVDRSGKQIAASLMRYQGLKPKRCGFKAQLALNTVTGCTALLNRALLQKALPVPEQALMHDWWLSIVASAFGRVYCVERSLVDYRQHEGNTLGANPKQTLNALRQPLNQLLPAGLQQSRQSQDARAQFLAGCVRQANAFAERYGAELTPAQWYCIEQLRRMPGWGLWRQRLWRRS